MAIRVPRNPDYMMPWPTDQTALATGSIASATATSHADILSDQRLSSPRDRSQWRLGNRGIMLITPIENDADGERRLDEPRH
jgi:hypothetical protein